MSPLSPAQRRALRAKAHHLHPVVSIGNHGLTPAVLHEIDLNLLAHELVKLRVFSDSREEREALLTRICDALEAAPVQHVGKVLVVYRPPREGEQETVEPVRARPRRRPGNATRAPVGTPAQRTPPRPASTRRDAAPTGPRPPRQRRRRPSPSGSDT